MLGFAEILLFLVTLLFFIMGLLIYCGHTNLIHAYHQRRIKESDKAAYGRSFVIGMFLCASTCLIAAIASYFERDNLLVILIGLAVSFGVLYKVQKKYNGGLF